MSVSPSAFRTWLRGEAEPSRERLVALADVANVGVAWLAKGEGPAPVCATPEHGGGHGRAGEAGQGVDPTRFIVLPRQAEGADASADEPPPPPDTGFIAFRNDWGAPGSASSRMT